MRESFTVFTSVESRLLGSSISRNARLLEPKVAPPPPVHPISDWVDFY